MVRMCSVLGWAFRVGYYISANKIIIPALCAPFILLYIFSNLEESYKIPVTLKVHFSEEKYVLTVLHGIRIPPVKDDSKNPVAAEQMYSEAERIRVLRKITPYVLPKVERLWKGAPKRTLIAYRQYLRDLDILSMPPIQFLPNYKNPCWRVKRTQENKCTAIKYESQIIKKPRANGILRCLPYFHLIGQPKCGTTEIYHRLMRHPDVVLPKGKEPFWFNRRRLFGGCSSLSAYLDVFDSQAAFIDVSTERNMSTFESNHPMVTGDGSVDLMWDNHIWYELPRNRKCKEPCFTNADYVHHLNPNARIIVALRDPVERVFSDYMYEHVFLKYNPDPEDFHKRIVETLYRYQECVERHSARYCAYDATLGSPLSIVRPFVGMYDVFLEDWLKVFPRDQIHVIKFEDYTMDTKNELEKLFTFLKLRQLSEHDWNVILDQTESNKRPKKATGEMLAETRKMLREFYAPHNKKLAAILNDARFSWNTTMR